jgi:hypothetical protein
MNEKELFMAYGVEWKPTISYRAWRKIDDATQTQSDPDEPDGIQDEDDNPIETGDRH